MNSQDKRMGLFYTVLLSSKRQTTLIPFTTQRASHTETEGMQQGEGSAGTRTHHNLPLDVIPAPCMKQSRQNSSDQVCTSAKAETTLSGGLDRQLLPLLSQHFQDQRKVSKKHSESQIENHH